MPLFLIFGIGVHETRRRLPWRDDRHRRPFDLTRAVAALLAPLLLCGSATTQAPQTFRTSTQTVAIYATVRDRSGRLVTTLTRDDFQVLDNGTPVQITSFSSQPTPTTIALLLDMAWSTGVGTPEVGREFQHIRDGAQRFVDAMLPTDRAVVGTFGHGVTLSPLVTSDKAVLKRILDEELWPSGVLTPLWAAIRVAMDSLTGQAGRRVVLVLSKSPDGCRSTKYGPALMAFFTQIWCRQDGRLDAKQAVAGELMVYAIGMESPGLEPDLAELADASGGGHFRLKDDADLASTFEAVADEIHHQYILGFRPALLDSTTHQLRVTVPTRDVAVRARTTYRAAAR